MLVDFWAEWCGPCKMVGPVLEEIAAEHADTLRVVKLNIDENPEVARQYGIMSIPTMSVFVGGEVAKSIVGAKPKAALLRDLEELRLNIGSPKPQRSSTSPGSSGPTARSGVSLAARILVFSPRRLTRCAPPSTGVSRSLS